MYHLKSRITNKGASAIDATALRTIVFRLKLLMCAREPLPTAEEGHSVSSSLNASRADNESELALATRSSENCI